MARPGGAMEHLPVPELCLWRPPTDNDGIATGWMAGIGVRGRWLGWGLDRLTMTDRSERRRGGVLTRITVWQAADGIAPIVHRQRVEVVDGIAVFAETVDIPAELDDLPRVGVRFAAPASLDDLEWFGPGPGDSYADRRAGVVARHRSTVADQYVDFVVPQEHGHHVDTRWFELRGDRGRSGLRIAADRRFGFNVSAYSVEAITAATHRAELVADGRVHVHVDAAHRGLGSAACGPDTAPEFRVRGGRHRWTWTLERWGDLDGRTA